MLEQVVAAFDRQDYQTASRLLNDLLKQAPRDPWVQFYLARLQEVSGKTKLAEGIYRQLLRTSANPKLIAQARQGLQRLEESDRAQRQQAIAEAVTDPANQALGFLMLEAVSGEDRSHLAQRFAQIMNIDAYSARGLLPARGWRLYRAGPIGELGFYGQELRNAGVPTFWATLAEVQAIPVFRVSYFQAVTPRPILVCQNEADQLGTLSFDWSEVVQRVEGFLPLFSQVVDLGYRDRLEWKEHIEDYANVCDLHLPQRGCILRIQDYQYDFHQGVSAHTAHDTLREHWNDLIGFLNQQLPQVPVWSDFTLFSETTEDFADHLSRIKSHIYLSRATDCYLDPAFHLYSSLAYLKVRPKT